METAETSLFATAVIVVLLFLLAPILIWTWWKGPWGKDIKVVVSGVTLFAWMILFSTPICIVLVPD